MTHWEKIEQEDRDGVLEIIMFTGHLREEIHESNLKILPRKEGGNKWMTSILQSKEKCFQKVRFNLITKMCPEFSFTVLLVILMKIIFS